MSIDELFAEVDTLPCAQRLRVFAVRAHELVPLAETLRHGDGFERGVGLFIAEVTRHGALVSSFLDDPGLRLRQRALSFLIRSGGIDATALRRFLSDASAQSRRGVWRELRRTHGCCRRVD